MIYLAHRCLDVVQVFYYSDTRMLLLKLYVPLNKLYLYAYLSIKFTIFAEEIDSDGV